MGHQRSFSQDLANLKGKEQVDKLLNQTCPADIPTVQQFPRLFLSKGELCFEYDASGNYIGLKECAALEVVKPPIFKPLALEQEETLELTLEDIKSFIKIYPNPTAGVFQVVFEEEIYGKIGQVDVFSPNGGRIKSKTLLPGENSTTFDINGYPSGVYVLKFTLHTQEFIHANLIKK
ncbi:T9SS type A sorting domain-containing protein [Myroides sp. mNGS23_01]|nr:T9SS type A sorting domain-containing protein [Myroides sp. mNGS23_01]WHT40135.1 T9SS type A sorting domain-containing protein [Myroides sp. mNGS23_01]